MTRPELRNVITDRVALSATLVGEAFGESIEGQIAVACVIRNRVKLDLGNDKRPDWWGEGYKGVCLAKSQFSCWWETNTNTERVYDVAEKLLQRAYLGGMISQIEWVAEGVINDIILDRVKGCDHYLTTRLLKSAPPVWTKGRRPALEVGSHSFFKLY